MSSAESLPRVLLVDFQLFVYNGDKNYDLMLVFLHTLLNEFTLKGKNLPKIWDDHILSL